MTSTPPTPSSGGRKKVPLRRVYDTIIGYCKQHRGTPPSVETLAALLQVSKSTVYSYLNALEAAGYIESKIGVSGAIEVVGATWTPPETRELDDDEDRFELVDQGEESYIIRLGAVYRKPENLTFRIYWEPRGELHFTVPVNNPVAGLLEKAAREGRLWLVRRL